MERQTNQPPYSINNMISFELAKKLKDAGFPQPLLTWIGAEKPPHYPALNELVERCGDRFSKLQKSTRKTGDRGVSDCWVASGLWSEPATYIQKTDKTPEEAVANLWLSLNN